ncbi:hypothetical protein G7K_6860-t1 [Saitoella complicata NRRL Y-17804]|uniref:Uncharacterized protein n=1 Tax=Saitoella complicata (strain BCRC 22490 / CBS 7301 / JCM 7358 / NBRC 10748 / NRRL Y-17804) TaxID=698492 RepID=A0A0E9NSQ2_SAICN|nr:hypothetical protein G7K_6860-t1 [Saitoella complicata NRRL Y-17804]
MAGFTSLPEGIPCPLLSFPSSGKKGTGKGWKGKNLLPALWQASYYLLSFHKNLLPALWQASYSLLTYSSYSLISFFPFFLFLPLLAHLLPFHSSLIPPAELRPDPFFPFLPIPFGERRGRGKDGKGMGLFIYAFPISYSLLSLLINNRIYIRGISLLLGMNLA